nr:transposase [Salipiger thiooxidans]
MSSSKFSDEFKRDAVAQITERGYPVREVSGRLGVGPGNLARVRLQLRCGFRDRGPQCADPACGIILILCSGDRKAQVPEHRIGQAEMLRRLDQ